MKKLIKYTIDALKLFLIVLVIVILLGGLVPLLAGSIEPPRSGHTPMFQVIPAPDPMPAIKPKYLPLGACQGWVWSWRHGKYIYSGIQDLNNCWHLL